ncbi:MULTISPECIES: GTP pyrophosphokinase [Bacillus cereus group]|uniref:RelA/SpoT domain-containing protein n=1 Tax=Bacillus cereus HuA2-1 TaxID=1053201 RepID=J9C0D1_BACCE|nr:MULTISPECIES: hypothetical protein [Bacillus cereus group]EJS13675.1 hypothetical protein IKS_02799 [Bacillus cereus VDM062]EJV84841.1 hypothetical protein IG3_02451 [Bacillus cereus HuA2-1]PFA88544.1 hypothetical protein CN400_07365 [Bacillus thuringiensis]
MSNTTQTKNMDEIVNWYKNNKPLYEALAKKVENIIKDVLDQNELTYYLITSRSKDLDSFANKAKKEKYADPKNEIKDLAGIRVITFVRSEVEACKNAIKPLFKLDNNHSIDKGKALGNDKVGYRSVHFVAELTEDRLQLPDFKPFEGLCFEIQIRTILEHAWADISHDRSYKFSGVLPPDNDIERRFSLAAAALELVDREFDSLASEIENYRESVKQHTNKGHLDIPLNTASLNEYLSQKFATSITNQIIEPSFNKLEEEIINELHSFGIYSLSDLDKLIGDNTNKFNVNTNFIGLLRNIMILNDAEKYFTDAWDCKWDFIDGDDCTFFMENGLDITSIAHKYKISTRFDIEFDDYE